MILFSLEIEKQIQELQSRRTGNEKSRGFDDGERVRILTSNLSRLLVYLIDLR